MERVIVNEPAQDRLAVASPRGQFPDMRLSLRKLAGGLAVIACGAVGFVVGWSSAPPGGLENGYRSGLLGLASGLIVGLLLVFALGAIMGRRHTSARQ